MLWSSWKNGEGIGLKSWPHWYRKYFGAGEPDKAGTSCVNLRLLFVLTGNGGKTKVTSQSWNSVGNKNGLCLSSKNIFDDGRYPGGWYPWHTISHPSPPRVVTGHILQVSSKRQIFCSKSCITSGGEVLCYFAHFSSFFPLHCTKSVLDVVW